MLLSRRGLLATTATLPLVAIGRARAAEFVYKLATGIPGVHPLNVRGQEACNRVREATGGQVEIQMFINNQLGNDSETLKKLQSGEVELFTLSGSLLSVVVPSASISGVGFAFKDYNQVWGAMDGGLGAYMRQDIAKYGIYAMRRIWNAGFRETTTSTKPIRTPDDYRGMKLRIPFSPLWTSMFKAFNTDAVKLTFNEVYAALQARTADGQENPLALIHTTKLYEVQTYCSLTNHMWDGYWMLANAQAWSRLPPRLRDIVEGEFDRSCQDERDDLVRLSPNLRGDLVDLGMEINPVDTASFQRVLQQSGFYAEWKGKFGDTAWRLLEASAGDLS